MWVTKKVEAEPFDDKIFQSWDTRGDLIPPSSGR